MQQKVQFVAAVIHEPDFMILDEPFSGLDPARSLVLKDVLLDLKKQGKTILFSTHRMDTVERLCDSICLVNQGRSVLLGVCARSRPATGAAAFSLNTKASCRCSPTARWLAAQRLWQLRGAAPGPRRRSQRMLEVAMRTARIRRFEMVEPSLEEIFIDTVSTKRKAVTHA